MKTWTKEEVEILKSNYNCVSNEELQKLIPNKSPLAIYKKAYLLGYRKTADNEFLNRSLARQREKSSSWKGGVKKNANGYRVLLKPEHPRADRNGYVMEHIVVFEEATNIIVPLECCIHHLNRDKNDNRIENLCMMTRSAHTKFHHTGTVRSEETKKRISERKKKK